LAATVTADLSKNYSFVATNNNVAYTGVTGLSAGDTNVDWTLITITNTSGSAKTIATPASWIDTATGVAGATTYYITNQAYLSIFRYPGAGTNFSYRGGTK